MPLARSIRAQFQQALNLPTTDFKFNHTVRIGVPQLVALVRAGVETLYCVQSLGNVVQIPAGCVFLCLLIPPFPYFPLLPFLLSLLPVPSPLLHSVLHTVINVNSSVKVAADFLHPSKIEIVHAAEVEREAYYPNIARADERQKLCRNVDLARASVRSLVGMARYSPALPFLS